jgi:hypothetical protein
LLLLMMTVQADVEWMWGAGEDMKATLAALTCEEALRMLFHADYIVVSAVVQKLVMMTVQAEVEHVRAAGEHMKANLAALTGEEALRKLEARAAEVREAIQAKQAKIEEQERTYQEAQRAADEAAAKAEAARYIPIDPPMSSTFLHESVHILREREKMFEEAQHAADEAAVKAEGCQVIVYPRSSAGVEPPPLRL